MAGEAPLFLVCTFTMAHLIPLMRPDWPRQAPGALIADGWGVAYDPPVRRRWLFGFFVFWLFSALAELL